MRRKKVAVRFYWTLWDVWSSIGMRLGRRQILEVSPQHFASLTTFCQCENIFQIQDYFEKWKISWQWKMTRISNLGTFFRSGIQSEHMLLIQEFKKIWPIWEYFANPQIFWKSCADHFYPPVDRFLHHVCKVQPWSRDFRRCYIQTAKYNLCSATCYIEKLGPGNFATSVPQSTTSVHLICGSESNFLSNISATLLWALHQSIPNDQWSWSCHADTEGSSDHL